MSHLAKCGGGSTGRIDATGKSYGLLGTSAMLFFDIWVFLPNAQSYRHSSIQSLYRQHELTKKRDYGDRIREIENGSCTPLVFVTTGGMGQEATLFYKRLADLIADKENTTYYKTTAWIRCTLSFSLLHSSVTCIRGSRSKTHRVPIANLQQRASSLRFFSMKNLCHKWTKGYMNSSHANVIHEP